MTPYETPNRSATCRPSRGQRAIVVVRTPSSPATSRGRSRSSSGSALTERVRLVPFAAGAHAGVAGSFEVLRFRDKRGATLAYIETIAGQLFVERRQEVDEYEDAFDRLAQKAFHPEVTMVVIAATVATL
jgi:hypothetical protein